MNGNITPDNMPLVFVVGRGRTVQGQVTLIYAGVMFIKKMY